MNYQTNLRGRCKLSNRPSGQLYSFLLLPVINSASDSLSVSVESLDETNMELADLDDDDDTELLPADHEPEAWSVTVDKKTLKRMTAKNIKRQDHIWGKLGQIFFINYSLHKES